MISRLLYIQSSVTNWTSKLNNVHADAVQGLYYKVTRWILLLFGVSCYFRTTFWYVPKSVMMIYNFNIDQLSYTFRGWNKQCLYKIFNFTSTIHSSTSPMFICMSAVTLLLSTIFDGCLISLTNRVSINVGWINKTTYSSRNWIKVD